MGFESSVSELGNRELRNRLLTIATEECASLGALLRHLGEFDERRLYLPEGYASMHAWCVGVLHFSEDAASRRITAARKARVIPGLLDAVAAGRLHLSAVVVLAPHLTPSNAAELIRAATHKKRAEIELLIAHHSPRPGVPTRLAPIATRNGAPEGTAPAGSLLDDADAKPAGPVVSHNPSAPARIELSAPEHPMASAASGAMPRLSKVSTPMAALLAARVSPLAPQRFALQVTIGQATHDKLRRAQALLAHHVHPRDVAEVLDRALDALVERLEKRKFARSSRPRTGRSCARPGSRHIPAAVKRAVHERDGGRCTFVGENGHRCEARDRLEFDHAHEFARGGESSIANVRLRCRAHNQYAAECTFGAGFMEAKRRTKRAPAQRSA